MGNPRVLVVDDEESMRHMLSLFLTKDGFDVSAVGSAKEGLSVLRTDGPFDVCVSDVRMPGMDGLTFIEEAQRFGARTPTFIAMSAYGDHHLAIEALRRGAFDYVSKPFDPSDLSLKVRMVVTRNALGRGRARPQARPVDEAPSHAKHHSLADVVFASEEMRAVISIVRRVAPFPTTVLLTGETGTGKERIASAIHGESSRASGAFVAVNCGAIPENLLESELFGHTKGAFTDAQTDRTGLFESAHGGTIFLDEIAELPVHLQVKLLRVLVEREVRPLGAVRSVPIDVRVIAATSRDLAALRSEGRFRDDLFHRLNVVPIHVPPLRERPADVRPLVEHFCANMEQRFGVPRIEVSDSAVALLEGYAWPGNVRELENALERAFVLSEGASSLTEADLDERFTQRSGPDSGPAVQSHGEPLLLRERLAEVEQQVIRKALDRTGGNRTRAADVLGISHRALLYKLKEYGIT